MSSDDELDLKLIKLKKLKTKLILQKNKGAKINNVMSGGSELTTEFTKPAYEKPAYEKPAYEKREGRPDNKSSATMDALQNVFTSNLQRTNGYLNSPEYMAASLMQNHAINQNQITPSFRPTTNLYINPQFDLMSKNPFRDEMISQWGQPVMMIQPTPVYTSGSVNVDYINTRDIDFPKNEADISNRREYYSLIRAHLISNRLQADGELITAAPTSGNAMTNPILRKWKPNGRQIPMTIEKTNQQRLLEVFPGQTPPDLNKEKSVINKAHFTNGHLRHYVLNDLESSLIGITPDLLYDRVKSMYAYDGSGQSYDSNFQQKLYNLNSNLSNLIDSGVSIDINYYNKCKSILVDTKENPNLTFLYAYFTVSDNKGLRDALGSYRDMTRLGNKVNIHGMDYDNNLKLSTGVALITEESEDLAEFMRDKAEIKSNRIFVRRNGIHTEDVWMSIIFQIIWSLAHLAYKGIYIDDLNSAIRIVATGNDKGYWVYRYNGMHYYVPNLGYRVTIDSPFYDVPKTSIMPKICFNLDKIGLSVNQNMLWKALNFILELPNKQINSKGENVSEPRIIHAAPIKIQHMIRGWISNIEKIHSLFDKFSRSNDSTLLYDNKPIVTGVIGSFSSSLIKRPSNMTPDFIHNEEIDNMNNMINNICKTPSKHTINILVQLVQHLTFKKIMLLEKEVLSYFFHSSIGSEVPVTSRIEATVAFNTATSFINANNIDPNCLYPVRDPLSYGHSKFMYEYIDKVEKINGNYQISSYAYDYISEKIVNKKRTLGSIIVENGKNPLSIPHEPKKLSSGAFHQFEKTPIDVYTWNVIV